MSEVNEILIVTTGGTIDKVYFDQLSDYQVGRSIVDSLLREAHVTNPYRIEALLEKDSLDLTEADRLLIRDTVSDSHARKVVITHGTDTMTETARYLDDIIDKTIVMTGSLSPARFAMTDASFNVGMAFAAVQTLDPGVYIAMNGTVFPAKTVVKNRKLNRFESKS
ncbi:MAG: asparaginase [Gammaproteobacteria bacterium]|nr:asparaginase [Gammaproteobacteria bacterium]MBT4492034.1 asparaginase [Gammaproteobacteria bacterium]